MVIIVSGTLPQIKQKILAMSAVVTFRKNQGWAPYQSDETWWYVTHPERSFFGVCPVCLGFAAQEQFIGSEIPTTFGDGVQVDPLHLIRPRVHMSRPDLGGECRCELLWLNAVEIIADRLGREMAEVSG